MTRHYTLAGCTLLALLGGACTDLLAPSACLDGVGFEIGSGVEPTFDWRPACPLNGLVVRTLEGSGSTVWSLGAPSTSNVIRPPVVYGTVPDGLSGLEPIPLTEGTGYRLTLYAWISNPITSGERRALDSVDFVP